MTNTFQYNENTIDQRVSCFCFLFVCFLKSHDMVNRCVAFRVAPRGAAENMGSPQSECVAFGVGLCGAAENRDGPQSTSVHLCGAGHAGLRPGSGCLVFSVQKAQQQEQSLR